MDSLKASKLYKVPRTILRRLTDKVDLPAYVATHVKLRRKLTLPLELEIQLVPCMLGKEAKLFIF